MIPLPPIWRDVIERWLAHFDAMAADPIAPLLVVAGAHDVILARRPPVAAWEAGLLAAWLADADPSTHRHLARSWCAGLEAAS